MLSLIDLSGERVRPVPPSLPLDDPDDLPFLEVAHSGGAEALITGSPRYYRGAAWHGVRVLSPTAFLRTPL